MAGARQVLGSGRVAAGIHSGEWRLPSVHHLRPLHLTQNLAIESYKLKTKRKALSLGK